MHKAIITDQPGGAVMIARQFVVNLRLIKPVYNW
jgi:hypothetical protein